MLKMNTQFGNLVIEDSGDISATKQIKDLFTEQTIEGEEAPNKKTEIKEMN